MSASGCPDRRVVDPVAAPLDICQHDGESVAVGMLELDLDRMVAPGDTNVGGDRERAQFGSPVSERGDARVDDLTGRWMLVGCVRSGMDHLRAAVGADRRGEREELTVAGQLLLREVDRGGEETVKVSLRLR